MTTPSFRRCAFAALALVIGAAARAAEPALSSSYVDFAKCKNLFVGGDEPEGEDQPIRCQGPGGYLAEEQYSAFTTWHIVTHPAMKEQLSLEPAQGQAWGAGKVLEFRQCDGRPFAVIQRITVCSGEGCTEGGKGGKMSELLLVQGLVGAESLRAEISTAKPKANERAREATDGWVRAHGCPPAPARTGKAG